MKATEKQMTEYRLIKKTRIEEIINSLERLQESSKRTSEDCKVLISDLKTEDATLTMLDTSPTKQIEKIKIKAFKKDGPTLADVIYDKVTVTSSFRAMYAYEAIKEFVEFAGGRNTDSVRSALNNSKKLFKKTGKGLYKKIV